MAIAEHAGKRQIVEIGRAAVLAANNVIDLVRKTSIVFLDEAVFAAILSAPGYGGAQLLTDITRHETGAGEPSPLPSSECAPAL